MEDGSFYLLTGEGFSSNSTILLIVTICSFLWYKDEKEKETIFAITLDGLKLKNIEKGLLAKKITFALYHMSKSNIYKDLKQVNIPRLYLHLYIDIF